MGFSSLFRFTKGEIEAENIIRMAQLKLLMAYLKITSMGSPDLRVEGKANALFVISSAIMLSVRMVGTHHLMMITIIPGTSSMIRGMIGNASHQGNYRLFKKARNPRYEESNIVSDKIKKCYLVLGVIDRRVLSLIWQRWKQSWDHTWSRCHLSWKGCRECYPSMG